ncbi:MAG: hypothetical protein ACRCSK_00420 [Fusobacteriaceae bacterium]
MRKKDRFVGDVKELYTREILGKLFDTYFLDWMVDGYLGEDLANPKVSCMITADSDRDVLIDLVVRMFEPENFHKIFESLDDNMKTIFETIAWEGKFTIKKDRQLYFSGHTTFNLEKNLKDEYLFFQAKRDMKKNEYLTLPFDMMRELWNVLPEKSPDYEIRKTNKKYECYTANDEKTFMQNIKMYCDFYDQGGIAISSSGKILKESKENMAKYCKISEYFTEEKEMLYLKTETIALFFHLIDDGHIKADNFSADSMKKLVLDFLSGKIVRKEKFHYSFLYMNYLKGLKNSPKGKEIVEDCLGTIEKVVREFPVTKTSNPLISIDNIVKRILYQDEPIEIVSVEDAFGYIYLNEANYKRTKIETYENYLNYVVVPFIKSSFFVLAVLGVVEVFYEAPSQKISLYLKSGYLSKYEGLKAVRLTEFGKYVFGFPNNFEFNELKEEGEVQLDEDRLIATIIGEAPSKSMFFGKISTKIAPNKFKLTEESFLKDLMTATDVRERIETFKSKLSHELPECWGTFLEDMMKKTTAIKYIPEYIVLKLENEKTLIESISKDKRFKSHILKGEDFHILVKKDSLQIVADLFREYGFFMDIPKKF